MEGLEDMPDFWDMGDDEDAPGEHSDAVPEKGLPVIPLNKNLGIYPSNPFTPLIFLIVVIFAHRQETYRDFVHVHRRTETAAEREL